MLEWLERRFKSAYLNHLEDEVKRLRDENRQLVNSILTQHGMAGIDAQRVEKDFKPIKRANWVDWKRGKETLSREAAAKVAAVAQEAAAAGKKPAPAEKPNA